MKDRHREGPVDLHLIPLFKQLCAYRHPLYTYFFYDAIYYSLMVFQTILVQIYIR